MTRLALRKQGRQARESLSPTERHAATAAITEAALQLLRRLECTTVALYGATPVEVDTAPLHRALVARGHRVVYPRTPAAPAVMTFHHVESPTLLAPGNFNLPAPPPAAQRISLERIDAFIVPVVAFDDALNRIGQGGGYYDRTLAKAPHLHRRVVGIAFETQRAAPIAAKPWDVALDWLVTEARVRQRPSATARSD